MFSFLSPSRGASFGPRLLSFLLLLGTWWTPFLASAQAPWTWWPANNPDYSMAAGHAGNVQNTGCAQVGLAGNVLRVMCWDNMTGNQAPAGLSWSFSPDETPGNQGTIPFRKALPNQSTDKVEFAPSYVYDPDVVADPTHADAKYTKTRVLVTYSHLGPWIGGTRGILYELFEYDSQQNTMTSLGAPISLAPSGTNPNVDVDVDGNAVITWADNGKIYAMAYSFSLQLAYPVCLVAEDPDYVLSLPDVDVFSQRRKVTSFIYIATEANGNQTVRMNQVSRPLLESQVSVSIGVGTDIYPSGTGPYTAPRIAAPIDWQGIKDFDFEAVVYESSTNRIVMLSNDAQQYSVDIAGPPVSGVLNEYGDMDKTVKCSSPVLSYAGDGIVVCWIMADSPSSPIRNGTKEVIQTSMNWGGVANASYSPKPGYSIVNLKEKGDQYAVSVDGRFSPLPILGSSNLGSNALYCFYDRDDNDIYYKVARYSEIYLRKAPTTITSAPQQPVTAYPNPFKEATTLTLTLADNEAVQSLEVYDPMGQPVRGLKLPIVESTGIQQVQWEAANLKPGIYQVRMRTSSGATYSYRVQHE